MEIFFSPISLVLVKSNQATNVSIDQDPTMLVSSTESQSGGGHVRGDTAARSQFLRIPLRSRRKDSKMT